MNYRAQIDKYLSYIDSVRKMKGKDYQKSGRVEIINIHRYKDSVFNIDARIKGSYNTYYTIRINIQDGEQGQKFSSNCSCPDGSLHCKHLAAVLYEIRDNPVYLAKIEEEDKYSKGKSLIELVSKDNTFDANLIDELEKDNSDDINIHNSIDIPNSGAKLDLKLYLMENTKEIFIETYISKVGSNIIYRIKDLIMFFDKISNNEYYSYNAKFGMIHNIDKFEDSSKAILTFILKHAEALKIANYAINESNPYLYNNFSLKSNRLNLSGIVLDDFFNIMENREIDFKIGKKRHSIKLEKTVQEFKIYARKTKDNDYMIETNISGNVYILDGYKSQYLMNLDANMESICRLKNKLNKAEIEVLQMTKKANKNDILIKEKDMPLFISNVFPKIKKSFDISSIKGTSIESLMPKELTVKVLLDYNKRGDIILKPIYLYSDIEIKPLENKDMPLDSFRNISAERRAEEIFKMTGFELDENKHQYILKSDDDIYRFLTSEINIYMKNFEVMVTESFKSRDILKPKIGSLGVKVENNLLNIDFDKMNINEDELVDVLKQYRIKKKYYRLKDGTFLALENSNDLEVISEITENMNMDIKSIKNGGMQISLYRSSYLNNILSKTHDIEIKKDNKFKEIVSKVEESTELDYTIPNVVKDVLRDYQKVGYNWLKMLDEYKFGGILADDMGLGKTLQIIAIMLSYIESCKENNIVPKPSIVVCPSSLSLNWKNEIIKFNADINVLVIKGTAKERKELIKDINNHQLVITSYDLIKRDIDEYTNQNIEFKYIVVDEAQYIKNSNTQNSKAIKKLLGETRYALTGTPIENSLSELWSIFDYILPGYLYSYTKFRNNYESPIVKDKNDKVMKRLKTLIAPFILRRLKKDVLKELPDKTISILNNEMADEQTKIYNSYLMQARKEVNEELRSNGFEKSQIKILSLLTRLRQVCCHPSLFIDNYKGDSSKLIQCMELVDEAIESGHKILLFSQYTSMFEIIEKELKKQNVRYFKLTGQTKIEDRVKMVDEFNNTEDVKVFLISLKAGGTGLNLTAADTVIHYDPWWNLSAENQATDRAYRIGQKNAVQVYKLITNGTIEDKIQKMQERKGRLTDDVLSNEETFINKLTRDEIMELFD